MGEKLWHDVKMNAILLVLTKIFQIRLISFCRGAKELIRKKIIINAFKLACKL